MAGGSSFNNQENTDDEVKIETFEALVAVYEGLFKGLDASEILEMYGGIEGLERQIGAEGARLIERQANGEETSAERIIRSALKDTLDEEVLDNLLEMGGEDYELALDLELVKAGIDNPEAFLRSRGLIIGP